MLSARLRECVLQPATSCADHAAVVVGVRTATCQVGRWGVGGWYMCMGAACNAALLLVGCPSAVPAQRAAAAAAAVWQLVRVWHPGSRQPAWSASCRAAWLFAGALLSTQHHPAYVCGAWGAQRLLACTDDGSLAGCAWRWWLHVDQACACGNKQVKTLCACTSSWCLSQAQPERSASGAVGKCRRAVGLPPVAPKPTNLCERVPLACLPPAEGVPTSLVFMHHRGWREGEKPPPPHRLCAVQSPRQRRWCMWIPERARAWVCQCGVGYTRGLLQLQFACWRGKGAYGWVLWPRKLHWCGSACLCLIQWVGVLWTAVDCCCCCGWGRSTGTGWG
jgi:hypothetical protein